METVLANPSQILATSPQIFRITKENARELSAKAWEARRERKAKLEAQAKQGRQSTPQSERLTKQIEAIEELMQAEKDPDALSKLSMAHSRLFGAWQVLMAVPNPGSRRAKSVRSSPILEAAPISPVEPTPQAVVVEPVSKVYTGPENG